jgi:alpha-galactosidase
MHCSLLVIAVLVALLCATAQAAGPSPAKSEFAKRDKWLAEHFDAGPTALPWSFVYGGKPFSELVPGWKAGQSVRKLDRSRTQTTWVYADPATGLQVQCVRVVYSDFPTVEWTLKFKNTGESDTHIISDILAFDSKLRGQTDELTLYRLKGDSCTADSYQPLVEKLEPGTVKKLASKGGRPTDGDFPCFNFFYGCYPTTGEHDCLPIPQDPAELFWKKIPEEQCAGGVIVAVSWAGQWSAEFEMKSERDLHIAAGQELTHFKLHPGEEARSPMMVMQFYDGGVTRSQNIWRKWMLAHNSPRPGGRAPKLFTGTCICGMFPGLMSSEKDAEQIVDKYLAEGFHPEALDTDAGWYPCDPKIGWPQIGTWEPDPVRYPKGLRELSDYLHKHDIKHYVWFEPERVHSGTWLADNKPEWCSKGKDGGLIRLDLPDCLKWITDKVDSLITSEHIDMYRQDFNMEPLPHWRLDEPEDRQGIRENHHVVNYYAFWDELLRRHPGMLIDSCASGGRRNDLETLRRSVPLLRSDYQFEPLGNQAQTHGLANWLVYYGGGNYQDPEYVLHSSFMPYWCEAVDIRKPDVDWNIVRKAAKDHREVRDLFLGDYYPLTPWSLDPKEWIAFQFDRPDLGKGIVQAFRRAENKAETVTLNLQGLDPGATYSLRDLSSDWTARHTGQELMAGLEVPVKTCPGDAMVVYTRAGK